MRFLRALVAIVLLFGGTASAEESANYSEERNRPFYHISTEVFFPSNIGGYEIYRAVDYAGSDLASSNISLSYGDGADKLDIYLYDEGIPPIKERDDFDHEISVVEKTFALIQHLEAGGDYYENVEMQEELRLTKFGGENQPKAFASISFTFQDPSHNDEPSRDTYESCIAATVLDGYTIKIRHTSKKDQSGHSIAEKQKDAFLSEVIDLINDVTYRDWARKAIAILKEDPMNKQAAGDLVNAVEASPLIQITIGKDDLPFLGDDDFTGSDALFAAFIAGNAEAQIVTKQFMNQKVEGRRFMLETYRKLRESGKCDPLPLLDQWLAEQ